MSNAIRWDRKPSYSLKAAATCRELHQVRPVIAPWGNAMRLQLDHDLEVAQLIGDADRRAHARPTFNFVTVDNSLSILAIAKAAAIGVIFALVLL